MKGDRLELIDVSKKIEGKPIIDNISLSIKSGKVTCILGPSGSGKTTLLKLMNLLHFIDMGKIYFDGSLIIEAEKKKIPNHKKILDFLFFTDHSDRGFSSKVYVKHHLYRQKIGMVFQDFNLWSRKTVLENLTHVLLHVKSMKKHEAVARSKEVLEKVGLDGKLNSFPENLSGGERQRLAIARALIIDYEVLLLDEITSSLDPELVGEVLDVLRMLAGSGVTLVIVTHQVDFAKEIADYVVFLDKGKILEQGQAEKVLNSPKHPRTRAFLRDIKEAQL